MAAISQHFDVPTAQLFDVLVDPTTYPDWLTGAKHVREVSDEWPQPNSWFQHTVGFGPVSLRDRTSVVALTEPTHLVLLVRARPLIEAKVTFDIADSDGGCVLTMAEDPVGLYKLISPLAQPLIHARNQRSLHRLRELVSSR